MMSTTSPSPARVPVTTGQVVLFSVLALSALVLSIDVQGLLGAGDIKQSGVAVDDSTRAAWAVLDPGGRQFLERERETVVSEIQLRIQLEHLLFALKFALVGGTLYLLFQQAVGRRSTHFQRNEFTSLVSWAAVVAATIIDLRIAANQAFITTLGGWARQYEELTLGVRGVRLGWEAYLADVLLSQSIYPALRVSGQVLTVLLFSVTGAMFFLSSRRPRGARTSLVSGTGAVLSLVIMTAAAISLRRTPSAAVICLLSGGIGVAIACILARATRRGDQSPHRG